MKMVMKLIILLLVLFAACECRPVFLMHGLGDSDKEWVREKFIARLKTAGFSADDVVDIPLFNSNYSLLWPFDFDTIEELLDQCVLNQQPLNQSLTPLPLQVAGVVQFMKDMIKVSPERFANGWDIICHSQGGVVCSGVIAFWDEHGDPKVKANFHTFVSLAGPQRGIYFQHFPFNLVDGLARKLLYNEQAQGCASAANMWHDPHPAFGFQNTTYLPKLFQSNGGKKNFKSLKHAVFAVSPADEYIRPWQSAIWGFWRHVPIIGNQMTSLKQSDDYRHDMLGLKTLDRRRRLHLYILENVKHMEWVTSDDIFKTVILPFLDPTTSSPLFSEH